MGVRRLTLTAFRNYPSLEFNCDGRSVILTGSNGAGKTNILEALSYLAPGRGLRRAKYGEVKSTLCPDSNRWAVHAVLGEDSGWHVGTQVDWRDGKEKRSSKVNGHPLKTQMALGEYITFFWLTPQMDRLFQDGSSVRRRFLDRLVYGFAPNHGTLLTQYDHVMGERLRLLEMYGDSITARAWLDRLEEKMAVLGHQIHHGRRHFLKGLDGAIGGRESPFPKPILDLSFTDESADDQALLEMFKSTRARDGAAKSTTAGPHRTDLQVFFQNRNRPAATCSTGEQKALLLSIILGAAQLKRRQYDGMLLLLLDEVVAHLDAERRHRLFDEILDLKIQAWMTGTDPIFFQELGDQAQHFVVDMGHVHSHQT